MAWLYRVRDSQGTLLYIGITENMQGRFMDGHQHSAPWWPEMAGLSVVRFDDLPAARTAERAAIAAERPLWNIAGQPDRHLAAEARWGARPPRGDFETRMAQYDRAEILIRKALQRD